MKKCRITKTDSGYTVRGTYFLHRSDADMYAFTLANALNNGRKPIYVADVDEAIKMHDQLEGESNTDWLRLCWRRSAGCYLHTHNIYALRDNRIQDNPYQWYRDADQWWEYMTVETKAIISGIDDQTATEYHYRTFWDKVHPSNKDNMHQYWKHRRGIITLGKDDAHSLEMEIIGELSDLQLEREYGKDRAEMCAADGSFYEEYQDRFNDLYDDIEGRLLDNEL